MKSLAEIAHDVWWEKRDEGCSPRNVATRARWAFLNKRDREAWEASVEAVSAAIFERLGEVLDEEAAPEVPEKESA